LDVTTCVFAKELDPLTRVRRGIRLCGASQAVSPLAAREANRDDGDIRKPLITLQGTMDALLPDQPARAALPQRGGRRRQGLQHRLYEIQNGNHIERYRQSCCNFTQLEFLQPHVHDSFQRLVG